MNKEIIDEQTLLARFKRFGLKVSIEELNKIPETLQQQIYSDLLYFHERLYDEVARNKEFSAVALPLDPNRTIFIVVNKNRGSVFIIDELKKEFTQYITFKELDRFSRRDRELLNKLLNFNETKDSVLYNKINEINRYIHVILKNDEVRGSPSIFQGYTLDSDFEYELPHIE